MIMRMIGYTNRFKCGLLPGCNLPSWMKRANQTVGGTTTNFAVNNVQQCLDYCVVTLATCEGVDINFQSAPAISCRVHVNSNDYVPNNIGNAMGIDSYQLLGRCVSTTTQGSVTAVSRLIPFSTLAIQVMHSTRLTTCRYITTKAE